MCEGCPDTPTDDALIVYNADNTAGTVTVSAVGQSGPVPVPGLHEGIVDDLYIEQEKFREVLAADVPQDVAELAAAIGLVPAIWSSDTSNKAVAQPRTEIAARDTRERPAPVAPRAAVLHARLGGTARAPALFDDVVEGYNAYSPSGDVSLRMSMCSAIQPSSRAIFEAIRSAKHFLPSSALPP